MPEGINKKTEGIKEENEKLKNLATSRIKGIQAMIYPMGGNDTEILFLDELLGLLEKIDCSREDASKAINGIFSQAEKMDEGKSSNYH